MHNNDFVIEPSAFTIKVLSGTEEEEVEDNNDNMMEELEAVECDADVHPTSHAIAPVLPLLNCQAKARRLLQQSFHLSKSLQEA